MFISNIWCNVDHGTLPGGSQEIMESLDINEFKYGILGSVVYGGLTLGAAFATGLF